MLGRYGVFQKARLSVTMRRVRGGLRVSRWGCETLGIPYGISGSGEGPLELEAGVSYLHSAVGGIVPGVQRCCAYPPVSEGLSCQDDRWSVLVSPHAPLQHTGSTRHFSHTMSTGRGAPSTGGTAIDGQWEGDLCDKDRIKINIASE